MGLLQIKCIKFHQVTYFDAIPLMYNHHNNRTYTSHKNGWNNTQWRKNCLAVTKNKTFYIVKVTITSLMNEKNTIDLK
jgi:hypothetical protein